MADIPTPPGVLTDEEFDQIQAAGGPAAAPPELQSFYLAHVNQYNAFRATHPREKDRDAMAKRLSALDDLALDPDATAKRMQLDSILTAPPDQQAAAKDALLVDAHIQERLRRRTVISGSVWDAGRPPDQLAVDRDAARDALAVEVFGETAPRGSDAAVAAKLREAAHARRNMAWLVGGKDGTDEQSRKINESSMARWATRAGLAGESATAAFAAWKEQAKTSPAWTAEADSREMWPAFAQQYQDARAGAEPLRKKVASVFEKLLALSQSDKSAVMALPDFLEAVAPIEDIDTATLRQVVLPMIRAMAETRKDQDGRDMWAKIEESFRRPIDRALGSSWDTLGSLLAAAPQQGIPQPGMQEQQIAEVQAVGRRNVARALLRDITSSAIDPILTTAKTKAGKMAEQMVYDVAGSLGFMAMAAIPYAGAVLNAAGFADDNLANLLNQSPNLKPDDARALAWAAAPVQAGLEKVQQLGLMGKLPGFNKALNRLAGPGGNPLARFALYGAVATGAEYTIEKLQDATPMWAQDILASMKSDVPTANWDGFERFDLRALLAVAPLAIIGAGVNVARDSAATRALLSNEDAMRAVGMTEEAIQTVIEAPTIAAKVDAVREGYASRDPAKEPDVAWQDTVAGAVANSELKAAAQLQDDVEAAGIRAVRKTTLGGYSIIDNAGTKYEAATSEEAAEIVNRLANDASAWEEIKPLAELTELLDQRAASPTRASDTTARRSSSFASVLEEQTEIMDDATLPEATRAKARKFVDNLMARLDIYEKIEGKKADLTKLQIGGQSEMEVRNGVATAVVQVGMGTNLYVVIEERVEADLTALLRSGEMTVERAAAEIRQAEERMNRGVDEKKRVLFLAGYTDGENEAKDALAVKEAISRLAQVYITGRGIAGRAGAAIPQYMRDYRKATRARLKAAEAEGAAPSVFAYLKNRLEWMKTVVRQAIALNRAIREARAAGEPLAIEEFLQRVTGIAPQVEAAQEVEQQAADIYIPPEDEDLMPFNLWSFSMQEGLAAHKLTPEELEGFRLSTLHNLTLENLRHADKYGALPVPSIAVVPVGQTIEGFGEITLIGSRALGDPAQVPVFDADAYTARFPKAIYRKPSYKEWSSLLKKIRPFDRKFQDGLEGYADQYMQSAAADELMQRVGDSRTAAAMYLAEEYGIQIEPVRVVYTPTNRWIEDREFLDAVDNGALNIATDNEVDRKAFGAILRRVINRYYDAIAAGKDAGRARQLVEIMRDATLAKWIEEDGQSRPDLWSLTHDVQQLGSTIPDHTATEKILRDALNEDNRHAGFRAWAERTFMAPFGEPRMELKGRKVPFTLDNIVASMASADPRGKEIMFGKPLGYWRGYSALRFADVEQMRARAASNIVPKADTAPAHAESKKAVMDWSAKVSGFYKGQYAMDMGSFMAAIAKYLRGRRTPAAFRVALETEGFRSVPDDVVTEGIAAAEKFANAPVPYFEAKPQRAVRLSEFPAAVVWEDTPEEAVKILEGYGVQVVRAPASGRDDPTLKQRVLSDAIRNSGASFSLTENQFDENRDRYLPSDYFEPFQKTPAPEDGQTVRTKGDLSAVVIPWGIMYAVRNGVTIGAIDGGSVQVAEDEQRKGVGLFLLQAWEAHTGQPMRLGSHTVAGRNLFERYWADKAGGASFSLQPDTMLDNLATQVGTTMARAPQARLAMVGRAKDNLAALKDSFLRGRTGGFTPERSVASLQSEQDMRQAVREQELLQAAGVSLTSAQDIRIGRADAYRAELANQLAARGVEEKSPQRIRREANFRQALEREKMLAQTDEDYSRSLSQIYREFGFWDGTVMSFLSRKAKGARTGILMSYRKAQRFAGKGEFVNHGPWDGSEELPRILFSGTTQPDVAAMELFSAHPEVFPAGTTAADVTPDMMWDAISRELAENAKLAGVWDDYQKAVRATEQQAKEWGDAWVENYRRQLAEARAEAERAGNAYVAEATGNNTQAIAAAAQARQEAAEWRKRADRWQAADWNDKAVLTRAMRTLDAILAAFPPDIRGKVGGWLSLARLGSAESMAKEIGRRIDMLDRELEKSLRADAIEQIRDLIETAKPKREGGKKPTGKIGAAAHRYFDAMASVVDMSATEVEAMRLALDTELAAATTPEQQADIWEKQQILDTFGGLEAKDAAGVPLHDAADLEAALAQAQQVYTTGRNYWRTIEEARLADIAAKTAATAAAMPAVKVQALLAQGDAAKRISGMLRNTSLSLRSFREILEILLGRGNPLAQQWADMAMDAMHQRTDDMRKLSRRWFDAARKSTKLNRQKTEDALWSLITARTVAVTLRPGQPVAERIPIERIPNMAALGYNAQEIADAEAAFDALPLDTMKEYVEIERWQPGAEEPVELTQAEAIYISMLAAQTQYASPLARAGWGTETMQELEAALSPLAKDMRSFMADEYREGYYPLASLFEGMFGVSLPQIENYAPGKWWSRGAEKAMDSTQAGLVEGGFRAGFLKSRKAHQAAPKVANAFEVFFGHANQTAHWRAMAPLARELRAVFADPGIKQQITAAHGPEMLATVNRWLESLEGNGLQMGYSQAYQNLLSWQATVALAWKVGTLMKQATAMLGSAFKIPLRAYMRGMGRFIRGELDVQDIWQSDMIQRRVKSGFSPEVRLAVAKTMMARPTRRERFLRQGMELIGYVDAAFTTISAAIAYDYHFEQAKAAGLSEAAAKRQAMSETQRIVTMTAQPVEVTDRSLFEQTGWGKMLLMFGGDSRQKASMWVTALAAAIKGKATPDDIRVLAISHLIIGPMLQIITSAWMDWRDDDDDEIFDEKNWEAWDMVRSVLLGPAAGLPLIREIVDDFSGDSGPLAATGKAAADAVAIVKGPADSEDEKVEWYGKRIAGVLKGLSAFPAVLAGIGDQVFRVSDNLIETDDEIRAKIQTLQRKLEREKDREEQDALRERILGLQSKLK